MEVLRVDAQQNLVREARGGDRNAFDALLGPLVAPAFRLAMGMLHDREAAEDAVQEAAFRAWRKLGNLREGINKVPGPPPGYPTGPYIQVVAPCT
jgi:RNA polymerase sigma-70 factor (ECF subfamily)